MKLRRPPDHAVGLPVPDALHHLLLQHLLPGGRLARTGVHYGVAQLPLLIRPGDLHPHVRRRDGQPTASGWIPNQMWRLWYWMILTDTLGKCFGSPLLVEAFHFKIWPSPALPHVAVFAPVFRHLHPVNSFRAFALRSWWWLEGAWQLWAKAWGIESYQLDSLMQVSMLKALLQVPSFLQWMVTSLSPVLG